MNVSDVVFEMELNGVDTADIANIVKLCESKGYHSDFIDDELLKRAYNAYDEYNDWEEDEYPSIEKFPPKKQYS